MAIINRNGPMAFALLLSLSLFIGFISAPPVAEAAGPSLSNFLSLGPGGGGSVFSAVYHNSNPQIILAGQDVGGISKSTDGGATWRHVNQGGLSYPALTADVYGIVEFAADPSDDNVFYAATWNGLFRSDDVGETWTRVIPAGTPAVSDPIISFSWVAFSPTTPGVVLVGSGDWRTPETGNGFYRSTDGGLTFTQAVAAGIPTGASINSIAFDPADGSAFAATTAGLFKSTDNGDNFTKVAFAFRHDSGQWIGIEGTPRSRTFWYVLHVLGNDGDPASWSGGVYRSTDGVTWTEVTDVPHVLNTDELLRPLGARINPADNSILFLNLRTDQAQGSTYKYDGTSWADLLAGATTNWNEGHEPLAPEGLAVSGADPNQMLSLSPVAIMKSADGGATWAQVSSTQVNNNWAGTGAEVTQIWDLAISQEVFYQAAEDIGIWRSDDRGASWKQLLWQPAGPDGPDGSSEAYVHPGDANRAYFAVSSWSIDIREGAGSFIYKTTDGGTTMADITPPAVPPGVGRAALAVVWGTTPEQDTLYAAFHGDRLYKSTDGGTTWATSDIGMDATDRTMIFRLTVDPSDSGHVFAGLYTQFGDLASPGGLYESTDGGANWAKVTGYPYQDVYVVRFAGEPKRLFVGGWTTDPNTGSSTGSLMVSDDFTTFTSVLDQPYVNDVIDAPGAPGTLYAASSTAFSPGINQNAGIYRSTDNGATWARIEGLLPHNHLNRLAFFPDQPDRIYMATNGDGIIAATIVEPTCVLGDANRDGTVNILDSIFALNVVLGTRPQPADLCAIDMDASTTVDITDVIKIMLASISGVPTGFKEVTASVAAQLPGGVPGDNLTLTSGILYEQPLSTTGDTPIGFNASGVQLAALKDASGNPVMLSLVFYPEEGSAVSVSSQTTAEALVLMNPFIAAMMLKDQATDMKIKEIVAGLPEVQALAALLEQKLATNPDILVNMDQETIDATAAAVDAALAALRSSTVGKTAGAMGKLEITYPNTPGGITIKKEKAPDAPNYKLTFTNHSSRYIEIHIEDSNGNAVGDPAELMVGPASGFVSATPLGATSTTGKFDARDIADSDAKVKVYGPGSTNLSAVDDYFRLFIPAERTILVQFGAPILGMFTGLGKNCLGGLVTNIDGLLTGDVTVRNTITNYLKDDSFKKAIIYGAIEAAKAVITDRESVLTNSVIQCGAGALLGAIGKKVATYLIPFAGQAKLVYDVTVTGYQLIPSLAGVLLYPWYAEWPLKNYLEFSAAPDNDEGAPPLTVHFLSNCPYGYTCTNYRWDFGDGATGTGAEPSHTYTAQGVFTVTVTAEDEDGATKKYQMTINTNILRVASTSPAADAVETSVDSTISVTFNNDIDPATVNGYSIFVKKKDDLGEPIAGALSTAGSVVTFTPSAPLEENVTYVVYISQVDSIVDKNGARMHDPYEFSFKTPDNLPPEVKDAIPYNGGIAEPATTMEATFNEPVDPATVNRQTFFLTDANGDYVPGSVSLSEDDWLAVLKPARALQKNKTYTATLAAAVKDKVGNPMAAPFTWTFQIEGDKVDVKGLAVLARRGENYGSYSNSYWPVLKRLDGKYELKISNIYSSGFLSGAVSKDGSHMVIYTGTAYKPYIWKAYIIKPPLIPLMDGTWWADIENTIQDPPGAGWTADLDIAPDGRVLISDTMYGGTMLWDVQSGNTVTIQTGDSGIGSEHRRAGAFSPDGSQIVWGGPGANSDPDQWVENVNAQIWTGDSYGNGKTQLTHIGRSDLSGSSNPNDPDYNPNYGMMNYYPEIFCDRTPCPTYDDFYWGSTSAAELGNSLAMDSMGTVWFILSPTILHYPRLYQMNGGFFNMVRELTSPMWHFLIRIDPDNNLLVAPYYSHLIIQSLDGSFSKNLFAEPKDGLASSPTLDLLSSIGSNEGNGNIITPIAPWIHGDTDLDGLDNWDEYKYGTNGHNPDTDGDTIDDGLEVLQGTNPRLRDTDHDGLTDDEELNLWYTDPLNPDTDDDGVWDGLEVQAGFDPLTPEVDHDGDGLPSKGEVAWGTDPLNADTDGDGLSDGVETRKNDYTDPNSTGTNPLSADTDGDGVKDGQEVGAGFNPLVTQTDHDGDGVSSVDEVRLGSDPLDPASVPITGYTLTELTSFGPFSPQETIDSAEATVKGDDSSSGYTLPWNFPFYGLQVNAVTLDTNGNLWLAANAGSNHAFNLPDASTIPVMALWNADLSSSEYGQGVRVQTKTSPNRIVADWDTETYSEEGDNRLNNFEVVLYPNGYILYRYNSFETQGTDDYSSGISLANGVDYVDQTATLGQPVPELGGRVFLYEPALPGDTDGDGLTDAEEATLGTDPNVADSNGDGLKDGWHVYILGNNPLSTDTDGDGLSNAQETALGTSPLITDTDHDGLSDFDEVNRDGDLTTYQAGVDTDPLNADTDADGVGDGAEVAAGFDPLVTQTDHDGDGVPSLTEVQNGTDPLKADTDGDGLSDLIESNTGVFVDSTDTGTDPLQVDTDGDGLNDNVETNSGVFVDASNPGTDPLHADTDGDGVNDGVEVQFATDPLSNTSIPIAFSSSGPITTVRQPILIISGDINNDAKFDLVQIFNNGSYIVLLGDGDGGFAAGTAIPTTYSIIAAQLIDIDMDGNLDLLLADYNYNSGEVKFLKGDGAGAFAAGVAATTTNVPEDIKTGDLNEDGLPDIVVGDTSNQIISVFTGDGLGAFSPAGSQPVAPLYPKVLALGDFNGDGHLDVAAIGNYYENASIAFLFGDGLGGLSAPVFMTTNGIPYDLSPTDLNNNGKTDLVVTMKDGSVVSFLGDGTGVFSESSRVTTVAGYPYFLAVGDFNDDNVPDAAVDDNGTVNILLGDGTGKLYTALGLTLTVAGPMVVEDFDGNGKPDLAVSSYYYYDAAQALSIWLNTSP